MPTNPALLPENIASEQQVIHPALDWRDEMLVMGAMLSDGGRAVVTSRSQILNLGQLPWPICDRAANFSRSPITETVANRFRSGYGAPTNSESAYALTAVPSKLAAYYRRFVVFEHSWWPDVLALWTLGTYLYPIFSAYPYLRISSPEPGCGKSLLGQIIANLTFNGELMASPTEANIFRLAESERGTQVWDEVENENNSDQSRLHMMKGVLLNGYRAGASIPRQERVARGQFTTVRFHVYVPRVFIGLSDLPTVVQQRTLGLNLHRRSASDDFERYRPNERASEEAELRELCALYALSYCRAVARNYGKPELVQRLERQLGQAGRLVDDLVLPLFSIGASSINQDVRSRAMVPTLRTLFHEAIPALAREWSRGAVTTPPWLPAVLDILEADDQTPTHLAELVALHSGDSLTAEQLSHRLARYGIRSIRSAGQRVFSLSATEIAQFRRRYGTNGSAEESQAIVVCTSGQNGQIGQ